MFVVVQIFFHFSFYLFFKKEYIGNNSLPKLGLAHPKLGMVIESHPALICDKDAINSLAIGVGMGKP